MNGTHDNNNVALYASAGEDPHLSDTDEDNAPDAVIMGDYSARFEELMSDGDNGGEQGEDDADDDEEEGFVYDGVDADPTGGYREQLRQVLGADHEEDELEEEQEVERSLVHEVAENEKFAATIEDEAALGNGSPLRSPSSRPYLHPTISRLRSVTPQPSRTSSAASGATLHSHLHESASVVPSHFSALSRSSSITNLSANEASARDELVREILRWTQLRVVGEHIYAGQGPKTSALFGIQSSGSPTVMAANGLICVGTDSGRVLVFDFKQTLKCVCGSDASGKPFSPVTSLALSFDHTYVAVGHAAGHVELYDLRSPKAPARVVPPTTLAAVASGRQEGHLPGSRIVSVGFIAGRHTALVSADDCGLAFYHSLGKVLFVDATDILRILGKYPEEEAPEIPSGLGHRFRRRKTRKPATILSMVPLPLGTAAHPTDSYNLIALLTPIKLVIVGLKPSPKTWYRRHRESEEEVNSKSRFKGTLAWFPSVTVGSDLTSSPERDTKKTQANGAHPTSTPMLVYTWGESMHLLRVSESKITQNVKDAKGKVNKVEVGRIVFEEVGTWTASDDILALQWLNVNQIIVLTKIGFEIHDVRTFKLVERESFDAWSLVSPTLSHTTNGTITYSDAVSEVAHSVRVYKGKIFLLGQHGIQVGTLLTWADRILHFVEDGDFLSAIDLTRSYLVGEAPGNRNGLPDDPERLKSVIGQKLRELMVASAQYAFSEDRMRDGTHVTADGRGVDRTVLFEGLVSTCARASMALEDFDFFFEDLFQYYENSGISGIFLAQLEPFMLNGDIRQVPPRITQRLIALHAEVNRSDLVEKLIWHTDPECLDVNQAIPLCQQYHLYDALIYIYTRAIKDYLAPVVELMGLIRRVHQHRRQRANSSPTSMNSTDEKSIEPVILSAYKVYPFLADTLTGLTYPSEEPLPEDEAFEAKNAMYEFLFFGHSSVWPAGEGGKLVLTADEDSGVEPTYPYARLLLRFDPEAFLHTLDLAFEDAYLNDKTRKVNRLVITKILLEILATPNLSPEERTFVHIFIARNVPKYSQFIELRPSTLNNILIGLAEDPDTSTREDRQLAAEFLLSAYTPHESERILDLFKEAGFYRILRSWYRQGQQWPELLMTFLEDEDLPRRDVFPSVHEVLVSAKRVNKGKLPDNVAITLRQSLPDLLDVNIGNTAALINEHIPDCHEAALGALGPDYDQERFVYLQRLLQPPQKQDEDDEYEAYDAVVWLVDRDGEPRSALTKADAFDQQLSTRIAEAIVSNDDKSQDAISRSLHKLEGVTGTSIALCLERSQVTASTEFTLEDLWFQLLSSQIDCVQHVASCCSLEALGPTEGVPTDDPRAQREHGTISALRSLVHKTFSALMSVSSTRAVSFPRLFKRLVSSASTSKGNVSKGTLYTEFRTILTGMLESFRSEGDMLVITKHLVDRDVADTIRELVAERDKGWAPARGACGGCGSAFFSSKTLEDRPGGGGGEVQPESEPVIVSRTGAIYHTRCLPSEFSTNQVVNVH
ncbi:Golgi CORVET complex core vacuolar protein 8-domain-containing protein [Epithele typhae]|uniref:Golgi CORVET complex core vacuolar protein 8-domain-containing protein n=1 Tax=Epithele typhae TaxID=378194 RepID=UPI0020088623|nr:Golgi CORVET complex core vacuolar protein 8-domain-containing protein [Epithele typhae]KAH9929603.1 Golgi CORVET complex core vacuolar protein 8-domain-containing protein [Epithele typhae]